VRRGRRTSRRVVNRHLPDLVVRSRRVVLPTGIRPAALHILHGKLIGIMDFDNVGPGCALDDAADAAVLPGIVDTHVHVNEPGRSASENFETVTRAAAAGGVTTIVVTPLDTIPATVNVASLEKSQRAAAGNCFVDVGFWGGVVPGNASELPAMAAAGVFGFECSFVSSGSPGDQEGLDITLSGDRGIANSRQVTEAALRNAMPILAKVALPLLVHGELPGPIDAATMRVHDARGWISRTLRRSPDGRAYATYLATRPKAAENEAIGLSIDLCREFRVRTHIVHLSSSEALTPLYHARASGLSITAETCPHYLTFVADEIPDGAIVFACRPPIRERENREYLWAALAGGLLQMVVSDHSSTAVEMPKVPGDFLRARGGISSLPISLSATWTAACGRGYTLEQLAQWMCRAPARMAGFGRKGAIEVGYDADLVVFDPDADFIVDSRILKSSNPQILKSSNPQIGVVSPTPYEGRPLRGVVKRTYLRGALVYEEGRPMDGPRGRLLTR
jgi:allantoinase